MFGFLKKRPDPRDDAEVELLFLVLKRLHVMALDVSKLQASADRLTAAVDALIAAHGDPTAQAAVDAVVASLDAESAKAEAAVAPPVV